MAISEKGKFYLPNLQYRHIARLFTRHQTSLAVGKRISYQKYVTNIFFQNNVVTGSVLDINHGHRYQVTIPLHSAVPDVYKDIDIYHAECNCVNDSKFCCHIAAVLLRCKDLSSTTSMLTCCMYLLLINHHNKSFNKMLLCMFNMQSIANS